MTDKEVLQDHYSKQIASYSDHIKDIDNPDITALDDDAEVRSFCVERKLYYQLLLGNLNAKAEE